MEEKNSPQDVGIMTICEIRKNGGATVEYVNSQAKGLQMKIKDLTVENENLNIELNDVLEKIAFEYGIKINPAEDKQEFYGRVKAFIKNNLSIPKLQVLTLFLENGQVVKYAGRVQIKPGSKPKISGVQTYEIDMPVDMWPADNRFGNKEL